MSSPVLPEMRAVPPTIAAPPYVRRGRVPDPPRRPEIKNAATIARMRTACRIASEVLGAVAGAIRIGATTDELDAIAHTATIACGAYPSPLGYRGYPKSICTSINEVICHGIPDGTDLRDGDIISIDVSVFHDGVHGDVCQTFLVGDVDVVTRGLVAATRRALMAGVAAIAPGQPVNAIGAAIERELDGRYGIVREFIGHEIGRDFHGALVIPHFFDPSARARLEAGMTLTVEPMISLNQVPARILDDDWTAITVDRCPCAQFEHTVLVTPTGAEPLTTHALT